MTMGFSLRVKWKFWCQWLDVDSLFQKSPALNLFNERMTEIQPESL